ncbi:uncharacterized protein LOC142414084 [Mycteria americana]|uniref:uncharacterized protein LOC142414084 n=1 Tax=Mycteria americana TaxID=33587 RepID=UPI003F58B722
MGTPSLVHPDLGLGVHGDPPNDGPFARWVQASSPLAGRAYPLGWMHLAEVRWRHTGAIPPRKGTLLARGTTWAQVKRFSVPIVTGVPESDRVLPVKDPMAGGVGRFPGTAGHREHLRGWRRQIAVENPPLVGKAINRTHFNQTDRTGAGKGGGARPTWKLREHGGLHGRREGTTDSRSTPACVYQPAFKKERKQTPSIARPPEGTGEPPKQALPPILRAKTPAAALDLQPQWRTCRAPGPRSANLLPQLAKSCKMFPITSAGRARFVCRASSLGTSGTLGFPELQISSSWLWGSRDGGCSHPGETSRGWGDRGAGVTAMGAGIPGCRWLGAVLTARSSQPIRIPPPGSTGEERDPCCRLAAGAAGCGEAMQLSSSLLIPFPAALPHRHDQAVTGAGQRFADGMFFHREIPISVGTSQF